MKRKLFILTIPIFILLVAFGWLALVQAAMLHVNSLADNTTADGFCTLREAIINANDNAATHPDCPAGNGADTIYLTNLSGQITLLADLPPITDLAGTAVQGPGAGTLAISGNNSRRIFDVQNGAPFTLRDLTLRNASSSSPGSALRAAGGSAIDIWHSAFTANANSAINIQGGSLQVVDATFTNNATTGAGGGIRAVYNSSAAQPAPTMLIDDSTFSGNLAGGGHAIHQASGSLTLNNSVFSENGASGQGFGTVEYRDDIVVTITGCDFLDNQGYQGAALHDPWGNGAVWVENSQFIGNTGQAAGAIRHGGGRALTISHSTFGENTADPAQNGQGGAINSYAAITITASAFYSNTAQMGGVIYTHNDATGPVTIDDSLFMGNHAANSGGAIWYGRGLYVTNSTFYGNTAVNGGALASFEGWGDVVNSTFAHNGANNGAALYHLNMWYAAPSLQNSIIANPQWGNNCSASVAFPDNGGNLQWPNNSCNPAIQVADPLLDPAGPQDNGGPTWSIALQAGSPAIDLIPAGGGFFCPPADQRGAPRPVDGDGNSVADCDSGAYEAGGLAPAPTPTSEPTPLPLPTITPTPIPVLQLAKLAQDADGGSLLPGDTISYTIVVTNPYGFDVTGVTISDTIPAHTTYIDDSDTPEADADPDPLVWSDRAIPPGVTTFRFAVLVDGNAGGATITNVACLEQPAAPQQCTGPVEPPGGGEVVPQVNLGKTAVDLNGDLLVPGDIIRYTLTLTNPHAIAATNVVITDAIPANTTYIPNSATPPADDDANPLVWTLPTVSPGALTFQFDVTVNANAGGATIANVACFVQTAVAEVVCTDPVEPPDGGEVTAILAFGKQAQDMNGGILEEGDVIRYTLVVTNPHTVNVTGVTISDTIPAHTTYVPGSATPAADPTADPLVWGAQTIPPGVTLYQFDVTVNAGSLGQLVQNVACFSQPGLAQVCTAPVQPSGGGLVRMKLLLPIIVKQD